MSSRPSWCTTLRPNCGIKSKSQVNGIKLLRPFDSEFAIDALTDDGMAVEKPLQPASARRSRPTVTSGSGRDFGGGEGCLLTGSHGLPALDSRGLNLAEDHWTTKVMPCTLSILTH
jgi:hypothetical protein